MPQLICNTAILSCSFGAAPMPLLVLPELPVLADGEPVAVIADIVPDENIPSFVMCESLANPAVAAATAAAEGVPALISGSVCLCAWMGEISISFPGQEMVSIES